MEEIVISNKFVVSGVTGSVDYDQTDCCPTEVRCSVCGATQEFGDTGLGAHLNELVVWATEHKCARRLSVNHEKPGDDAG